MLIYPAIDLQDGRCVRLMHGDFDAATVYDDDPFARLQAFADDGARWVHVVDLDGAKAGSPAQHALIGAMAASSLLRIQTGGGVRSREDLARLLEAGAERVVVGSAAVQRPAEVQAWIDEFGRDRICLALDVKPMGEGWEVAIKGWTEGSGVSLDQALALYPEGKVRHILITDVSRDGAMLGPNKLLLADLIAKRPDLEIQASGGVATLEDVEALRWGGAAGVIIGRALYEARFTLAEAIGAG